jgi:hypothetical protein
VGAGPLRRLEAAYSPTAHQPLGGYMLASGSYASFVAAVMVLARRRRPRHGVTLGAGDLVLLSIATHKASRLLSKDAVTSFVRAPLTRFVGPAGEAEVNESVRASGEWRALGELVSCPFCLDVWTGTLFGTAFFFAPVAARWAASVLAAAAGADYLNLAYSALKRKA